MSDFEKWFRSLNANGKTVYFLGNEHKVSEMAWNRQQAIIDDLKAQLNNMEACYIEKKKEVDELQGKSRCIKSLVEQRNLAENMLRKISVAAQKKLPTFGAALRFNDEVKEILRGRS